MTANASSPAASSLQALLAEPTASAWFRRPALWGGLLLTATALAGAWFWQARQAASTAPSYTAQAVTRGKLTLTVTANGTLQPTRSVSIGSELSGTVLKVHVDVNDRVRKGQILVDADHAEELLDHAVRCAIVVQHRQ